MSTASRLSIATAILILAGVLSGCGSAPTRAPQPPAQLASPTADAGPGLRAVYAADAQLGVPYRYGGSNPDGFDCSGLVQYAYSVAGIQVPRTTSAQLRAAQKVSLANLRPGDLVFFRFAWKPSHVGIYAGGGRFIHAPSTGKEVSYERLDNPFWRERVVAAGRVY